MAALKRYVIVRDIPDIHDKTPTELGSISVASCSALGKAGHGRVQWQHSYVSQGKTFCIYLAESEDAIREHASHGGFPVTSIHEVSSIIDPTTAGDAPTDLLGSGLPEPTANKHGKRSSGGMPCGKRLCFMLGLQRCLQFQPCSYLFSTCLLACLNCSVRSSPSVVLAPALWVCAVLM